MTLVAVDAVVDVSGYVWVMEVIRVVAAVAVRALEHRVVIRVRVAREADTVGIAVVDRERRVLGVVERRAGPSRGVMAVLACSREELGLRRVAGICCVVVVGLMTTDTGGGQRRVVVVYMAVRAHARRHLVRTGQRESGVVVIKRGIRPVCRVVAELACSWESGRSVRGIARAGVVLLVA